METGNCVSYLRVSTVRQGISGLGLEAQRDAVTGYIRGRRWKLVQEVVEVESGKRNGRPAIAEALRLCRLHRAILVIAKLDRLARNVKFVSDLMESGVEFVAVDFPQANRLTVHILAAVAEHEAAMISDRTKAALAAAKVRGARLGGQRGETSRMSDQDLLPVMAEIQASGRTTLRQIAEGLNAKRIAAPRGGLWSPVQIHRVLGKIGEGHPQ